MWDGCTLASPTDLKIKELVGRLHEALLAERVVRIELPALRPN